MYLCYCDETGNDGMLVKNGRQQEVTPLFVMTTLSIHQNDWKNQYQAFYGFRKGIKERFGLPVKMEFHTLPFLKNKNPYRGLSINDTDRLDIMEHFIGFFATMSDISMTNVVINKQKIKVTDNRILEWAFGYSLQRIENTIDHASQNERFLLISDPGRIGKMRKVARKLQKINFIPSMFSPSSYRQELSLMVEDVLEKDSRESYFIQIADTIGFVVSQFMQLELGVRGLPKRMPDGLNEQKIEEWMETLKPILNLKASRNHAYGVVLHPK